MRKYLVCISESISFVTDKFLYILRILLPAMLLFAVSVTAVCYCSPMSLSGIAGIAGMAFSFLLLQGAVFRLWQVKERGIEVSAQKYKSVYAGALRNVGATLNPLRWADCCKYFNAHFSEVFPLAVCLVVFYGIVLSVLAAPLVAIGVIRYVVSQSMDSGDVVHLPSGLGVQFCIVLFLVSYVLAVVSSVSVLPYKVLAKQLMKDDKE